MIGIFVVASNRRLPTPAAPSQVSIASDPNVIKYLALGDSYTIGESVAETERWPNQLVRRLQSDGTQLQIVANPSVTGYTTQDLIDHELPLMATLKPDFVTILIGVNDYVQGVDPTVFRQRFEFIVDSVQKQMSDPANVVLVTIPDYGRTPAGARFGPALETENGIKAFNAIITETATNRNVPLADIFAVSQLVTEDPALVASDGLHPSGKQYAAWAGIVYETVRLKSLLKD